MDPVILKSCISVHKKFCNTDYQEPANLMISPQEKEKEKKEPTISDKREILPKKKKKVSISIKININNESCNTEIQQNHAYITHEKFSKNQQCPKKEKY